MAKSVKSSIGFGVREALWVGMDKNQKLTSSPFLSSLSSDKRLAGEVTTIGSGTQPARTMLAGLGTTYFSRLGCDKQIQTQRLGV